MYNIQMRDQCLHLCSNIDTPLKGQRQTIAMSAGTDLDHLLVLCNHRPNRRKVYLLSNQTHGSLYPLKRCPTVSTVAGLDLDDLVWVSMVFSVMAHMSWLTTRLL